MCRIRDINVVAYDTTITYCYRVHGRQHAVRAYVDIIANGYASIQPLVVARTVGFESAVTHDLGVFTDIYALRIYDPTRQVNG